MEQSVDPSTPVPVAVKEAIATLEECHPSQLGRLDAVVDGDRLEAISDGSSAEQSVQFQYCGYTVTVESGETFRIDR